MELVNLFEAAKQRIKKLTKVKRNQRRKELLKQIKKAIDDDIEIGSFDTNSYSFESLDKNKDSWCLVIDQCKKDK